MKIGGKKNWLRQSGKMTVTTFREASKQLRLTMFKCGVIASR